MKWNIIETENDINKLIDIFGGFHDGCLKEMKYISGACIDSDLSMCPFNMLRNVYMVFQRQYNDPCSIEILFEKIHKFNLEPTSENYDCIIFEASLKKIDNLYYWCDLPDFDLKNPEGTWISSEKIKWRPTDNYIGDKDIYKAFDF